MFIAVRKPPVLSVVGLLRPHWKAMTLAMVGVAGAAGTEILEPWPLKYVIDHLFDGNPFAVIRMAVMGVAAIAVGAAASSCLQNYLTTTVGQQVMHDLRLVLYHHIHRLSLAEHDETRTGDLISRVTSDIQTIQDFVTSALLGILTNALTLIGIVGVMLYLNWRFTLISLSIAPLLFIVIYVFTRRIKKASRDVRKKEGELLSIVQEVFSSIRVVKAFAREEYEQRRFEAQSLDNVETTLRARNIKMMLPPVVEIILATGTCLMLWYGARLVLSGGLTAGSLVMFLLYLGKMYKPMKDLSKMTDAVAKAGVSLERIREVLDTESGVRDRPRARKASRFTGAIAFDTVSFAYRPDHVILNDVSFAIEPGQIAAFVGPTGGGKSTIINLVARFYDPVSGTVSIDGTDIRQYTMKSVREQISFVLQETLLFHAPIWQNIAYGRPAATRADIIGAAVTANADEFITQMPEGYDTMVGERGVTLSGGQRQRIAIARAVIRDTRILVMDEPTSGLDSQSEQVVFEALGRLMEGKTSIVIAHHLATIRKADVIFVVKDHVIAERGTHETLRASGGFYAELHAIQNRAEDAPVAPSMEAVLC
jgi:subfamily B ATP-binding cassette protein MsbA